ncbi:hypothetical protein B0A52_01587 [Exophiala mesophila]|uniref:Thioredoxin domain-containing protein n=1 Tax=Exophiala mesophila TaxID=212818 RepID=A0A438NFH7_EXOME|nr:hypothetical protein B0A52_01587 [Exophiala mesophila]
MKLLAPSSTRLTLFLHRGIKHDVQTSRIATSYCLHATPRQAARFPFSTTSAFQSPSNGILSPFRTPPQFHDSLQLHSANNALLLTLFTTSSCAPCRVIAPLLTDLVKSRAPSPNDKFSSLALAELELDSPDTSNGRMMDLGIEYGVTSLPTLIGFGGRRAQRVTDRVVDTKLLTDRARMEQWVDEVMSKGDPFAVDGGSGGVGGSGSGVLGRLFG